MIDGRTTGCSCGCGLPSSGRWYRRGSRIILVVDAPSQGELEDELTAAQKQTLRQLALQKAQGLGHTNKGGGNARRNVHEAGIARKADAIYQAALRRAEQQGFATAVAQLQRELELEGEHLAFW